MTKKKAVDFATNNTLGAATGAASLPKGGYQLGLSQGAAGSYGPTAGGISQLTAPLAPLSMAAGVDQAITGFGQLKDGEVWEGGKNMAAGAGATVSGVDGTLGLMGFGGGVVEGAGFLGMGVSPLMGLSGVGMALSGGITLGEMGNQFYQEQGLLGQNNDGSNRDLSDLAEFKGSQKHDEVMAATGNPHLADLDGLASMLGWSVAGAVAAIPGGLTQLVCEFGGAMGIEKHKPVKSDPMAMLLGEAPIPGVPWYGPEEQTPEPSMFDLNPTVQTLISGGFNQPGQSSY